MITAVPATPAALGAKAPITRSDLKPISRNLRREPRIPRQRQGPAVRLIRKDIVRGHGRRVRSGDRLTVRYTGSALSTGKKFDASWDRHQPFTFRIGTGRVIAGWEQGLLGMRVGGRRELVIPARLAYGAAGSGPIGPGESLIFVVDLRSAR